MCTIQEINSTIVSGQFTNDQLHSILQAVTFARAQVRRNTMRSLRVGDTVRFTNSRNGQLVQGTVEKIAIKFVTVKTATTKWKCPGNMLEKV
jgi:tRNA(Ile2) C34 agmatinyltransferase TiaS